VEKYGREGQDTDDNIIWRLRIAGWVTTTDTQSEYFINLAFPRQQCLREHASVLRYTYTAVLFVLFKPLRRLDY